MPKATRTDLRSHPRVAALALLLGAALVAGAGPAAALTVGAGGPSPITVTPLWYNGPGLYGIQAPVAFDWTATPANAWVAAAAGTPAQPLQITQSLKLPAIQHPQDPAKSSSPGTPQGTPTKTTPFVGDSLWTVKNNTGQQLVAPLLVITFVDYQTTSYPNVPVALDDGLIDVVRYTAQGQTYLFGAMPLGPLAPGESKQVRIRYIVGGALPLVGGNYQLPQLAVSGVLDATRVPEPSALLLVAAGLAAVASVRRRAG